MLSAPPRKLVTLRCITKVDRMKGKHRNHDVVTIDGGWQVIVFRNHFRLNDVVVYFEIDSFIPVTSARFKWDEQNKLIEFNGERGYHVRSQMLGTQISQGLVQHLPAIPEVDKLLAKLETGHGREKAIQLAQGMRLDAIVGVRKSEVPSENHGKVLGRVPTFFPRPACDRVQNIPGLFSTSEYRDSVFQITEKIDGVSMTVYKVATGSKWHRALAYHPHQTTQNEFQIGVCSASMDLDERDRENVYWQGASRAGLLPRTIVEVGNYLGIKNIAIQGELIGPSIKNNSCNFHHADAPHELILFQIFDIDKQKYVDPRKVVQACAHFHLPHVPVYGYFHLSEFARSVPDVLHKAEGTGLMGQTREGFVCKSVSDEFAFKVISNKWLLEQGQ